MKIRAVALDDVGGPVKVETVDLDAPGRLPVEIGGVPALIATVEDRFSRSLNGQHCQNRSGTNAA